MSRTPRRHVLIALPLAVMLICKIAEAAETSPQALLKIYRCTVCHSERDTLTGPAWANVAEHYRATPRAVQIVAGKIRSGAHSGGPWHMPPHPEVSKADATTMARYILALRP